MFTKVNDCVPLCTKLSVIFSLDCHQSSKYRKSVHKNVSEFPWSDQDDMNIKTFHDTCPFRIYVNRNSRYCSFDHYISAWLELMSKIMAHEICYCFGRKFTGEWTLTIPQGMMSQEFSKPKCHLVKNIVGLMQQYVSCPIKFEYFV